MDKTTRYLILVFIFIVFLALAPLIVLYVSGRSFSFDDFSNGTGILDVQSLPTDAQVLLDGKLTDNTPTTIRFIKQGTYQVEVRKSGFHPWSKQLFIVAGKVTYAGHLNDSVKLLPDDKPIKISDQQIKTFQVLENSILYVDQNNLATIYNLSSQQVDRSAPLSKPITEISKILSNNFLLAKNEQGQLYVLDTRTLILTQLPAELNKSSNIELIADKNLVYQLGNNLYAYTIASSDGPRLITKNIRAFTSNNSTLYIATPGANGLETYLWDGQTLSLQNVLYADDIPQGNSTTLYLTAHKELFMKVDRSLYRINDQPELINDQVDSVNINTIRQQLTFRTPTEIYFYNFNSGLAELFHRSSQNINEVFVVPELGYGFMSLDQKVLATEIDKRNGQNQYEIFNGSPIAKIALSSNENQLVILADKTIFSLTVNK